MIDDIRSLSHSLSRIAGLSLFRFLMIRQRQFQWFFQYDGVIRSRIRLIFFKNVLDNFVNLDIASSNNCQLVIITLSISIVNRRYVP